MSAVRTSMRTERAAQRIPSCSTLPQVSGRFLARITAPDRTCQRLAAPSSLPESDTGDWVSSIAWCWRGAASVSGLLGGHRAGRPHAAVDEGRLET